MQSSRHPPPPPPPPPSPTPVLRASRGSMEPRVCVARAGMREKSLSARPRARDRVMYGRARARGEYPSVRPSVHLSRGTSLRRGTARGNPRRSSTCPPRSVNPANDKTVHEHEGETSARVARPASTLPGSLLSLAATTAVTTICRGDLYDVSTRLLPLSIPSLRSEIIIVATVESRSARGMPRRRQRLRYRERNFGR